LWTREFRATGTQDRTLLGVAANTTGIFVLGSTRDNARIVLSRYATDGTDSWTRRLESSGPGNIATDESGVYVSGWDLPSGSVWLRKYSPEGVEIWTTRYGSSESSERPRGLSVNATGVYMLLVTGPSSELVMRKVDAQGSTLWARWFELLVDSPGTSMTTDMTRVYLLSGDRNGGYALRSYDASGSQLWSRRLAVLSPFINGAYLGDVTPAGMTADASGVYVTGFNRGNAPRDPEATHSSQSIPPRALSCGRASSARPTVRG
jgi:hypothetical protein